ANVETQTLINFPRVLSEPTDIMARTDPEGIVESLPVEKRQIQIQVLQGVQLYASGSRCSREKRSLIRRRYGPRNSVGGASLELIFPGEPEVIPEVVLDRAIRPAKFEGMLAPRHRHIVFELIALLVNDIRSAEVAPKPRQARYDQSRHGWLRRGGHRRVTRGELCPHLIDQIAPETVRPGDNRRIVAIGQAGANGRGRAVTG